jgi:hypothetical protein
MFEFMTGMEEIFSDVLVRGVSNSLKHSYPYQKIVPRSDKMQLHIMCEFVLHRNIDILEPRHAFSQNLEFLLRGSV